MKIHRNWMWQLRTLFSILRTLRILVLVQQLSLKNACALRDILDRLVSHVLPVTEKCKVVNFWATAFRTKWKSARQDIMVILREIFLVNFVHVLSPIRIISMFFILYTLFMLYTLLFLYSFIIFFYQGCHKSENSGKVEFVRETSGFILLKILEQNLIVRIMK